MSQRIFNLIAMALMIVTPAKSDGPPVETSNLSQPIRILCLGDSITQGGKRDREEYTYRYPLFQVLIDAGINFDFIGSMKAGLHPDATWPDYKGRPFDPDHEGHYGWKTAKVRDHLGGWLRTYPTPPDIVLIHLGTNDQRSDNIERDIINPLTDIVEILRKANPSVVILVGHLNFNDGAAIPTRAAVEHMVSNLNHETSPMITVHHYRGWNERPRQQGSDTFDWAHPNPQGQKKMAENWFESMRPYLFKARAEEAIQQP